MKLIFIQLIASHDFILDVHCISPAYIHVYGDRCADVSDEVLQKLQAEATNTFGAMVFWRALEFLE